MRRFTLIALAGFTSLLLLAPVASAHPRSVSHYYPLNTIYGTCGVHLSATATPQTGGAFGRVSGDQYVDCLDLSVTPTTFQVSSSVIGDDVVTRQTSNQTIAPRTGFLTSCWGQSTCSSQESRSPLLAGDYKVTHHLVLDISPGSLNSTTFFLDLPPECDTWNVDNGRVTCDVSEYVTL